MSKIFGIAGWKNTGKTSLIVRLIGELTGRGVRVSTLKHAHHNFEPDVSGKDSYLHRQAGASEVLVSGAQRWALISEVGEGEEARFPELLSKLAPSDLVLVEGFKTVEHPKIQVLRGNDPNQLAGFNAVCAYASDDAEWAKTVAGSARILESHDTAEIADYILANAVESSTLFEK